MKLSRRSLRWIAALTLASAGLGAAAVRAAAAPAIDVFITSPAPGEPALGEVELAVEVDSEEVVARVDFFVDGERVGELYEPPWRLRVDVGVEPGDHRFEVRAVSVSGATAQALLVSPALRVDEEVELELQQLYVTVLAGDRRVLDLEQEDFVIADDGASQELLTFARGDVRLTAVILVDASGSMTGRRLRFALRGAAAFVERLRPTDDASIQLFSDRLLHATPFSHDLETLTAGLARVEAEGGTALNDHVYYALKQLEHEQGRRVVILLSDGIDSHSALAMPEVRWLVRRSRALLYWIRSGGDASESSLYSAWKNAEQHREDYRLLGRTVAKSGGRVVTLERIEDAEAAILEVLLELREQYVLGYYPSNARNDGSWHRVHVRVRRPGLTVRARGGYIDY